MKTRFFLILFLLPALLLAKGENQRQRNKNVSYSFGGSTTVDKLMQLELERYRLVDPNVQLSYEGVGSSNGVRGALEGTYLLGGSSRKLKSSEEQAGAKSLAIAYDGIEVIVNNSVNIENINIKVLKSIFTGEITDWSQLRSDLSGRIVVINREAGSGTYASFQELVLGDAEYSRDALVTVSSGEVVSKVATTENSIGYVGVGYLEELGGRGHALSVNHHYASRESIVSGDYPISRSMFIVYTGELDGFKKTFTDFLLSEDGQKVVAESGFIPLN